MDGGYDEGYRACPCFWGDKPGSLVAQLLAQHSFAGKRVLDLGCGEGKNAAAFARAGASVTAVDCSELAISNGRSAFGNLNISWFVGEAVDFLSNNDPFDVVIMYGLLHCMPDASSVRLIINQAIALTITDGIHILVAFNDRSQDLTRAHPGFHPTLLPHTAYIDAYNTHEIVHETDTDLHEVHPHNGIPHCHSMSRMIVRIR